MKRKRSYNSRKGQKMNAAAKRVTEESMPINTQWFKDRIADMTTKNSQGRVVTIFSQNELARKIGIDRASLSRILNGEQRLTITLAPKLAEELGVPLSAVLENAGIDVSAGATAKVPVCGTISATGLVKPLKLRERVMGPVGMSARTEAFRYVTDDHKHGWLLFYVPSQRVERDVTGHLALATTAEGVAYVRLIKKGSKTGLWDLVDVLGDGQRVSDVRLASAAPVLWVQSWL
jgi:transcriptional regulator with XRE-family HTH domain